MNLPRIRRFLRTGTCPIFESSHGEAVLEAEGSSSSGKQTVRTASPPAVGVSAALCPVCASNPPISVAYAEGLAARMYSGPGYYPTVSSSTSNSLLLHLEVFLLAVETRRSSTHHLRSEITKRFRCVKCTFVSVAAFARYCLRYSVRASWGCSLPT
jgi:hypothetical protein